MMHGCTVILPTYNEAENIGNMISCIREMYPDFKILVMDDNSKDETKNIVLRIMESDTNVSFITRDINDKGLSASIIHGIVEVGTELFINMDSDFQHPPSSLGPMYEVLCSGSADLVIGVRTDRGALPPVRWFASWVAHAMANFTLKFRGKQGSGDVMSGLFGGRTGIYRAVIEEHEEEFDRRGFKALFDLLKFAPSDIRMEEVPFEFGKRQGGESKIGSKVIFSVMRQCGRIGRFMADACSRVKD
ncbi:MAG: glycosyltransferase [Methanomassiliicoccaceae archaeon]|jgi:dolichol-phosphate mannosyltransferase|nr:glycosyltransferase [Methanomassiliicoccaceae archaeon]